MVTREEVVAAYRLLLGRDPENEAVVRAHMKSRDIATLRHAFMQSAEFKSGGVRKTPVVLSEIVSAIDFAPPIRVDLATSEEVMHRLTARVERCWTAQGNSEPFWSVLSHERYKRENFAPNADSFPPLTSFTA